MNLSDVSIRTRRNLLETRFAESRRSVLIAGLARAEIFVPRRDELLTTHGVCVTSSLAV
jgi:hypothetical protein